MESQRGVVDKDSFRENDLRLPIIKSSQGLRRLSQVKEQEQKPKTSQGIAKVIELRELPKTDKPKLIAPILRPPFNLKSISRIKKNTDKQVVLMGDKEFNVAKNKLRQSRLAKYNLKK